MSTATFSYVLRQLMFKRNKTAHDIANETGLAPSSVYRILNGDAKTIRISTRFLLARALGVAPEAFDHEDILSHDLPEMAPAPTALSDSMSAAQPAPASAPPLSGGVRLYRLSQVAAMARGDDANPVREIPPPPFDDYRGFDLIAVEVPPGRRQAEPVEVGDVLYVRPWKEGETPDPMDGDMVLVVRVDGDGASLVRWTLTPPEGVRPFGRVVCFARSWI